jgi:hypothetical protein
MASISSTTSSQAALQQAQAKLAADQAAKASADVIKADQKAVDDAEKASSAPSSTAVSGPAAPAGLVDISA